jgi:hypothetical protein
LESAIKIGKSELGTAIKFGNGSKNESPLTRGLSAFWAEPSVDARCPVHKSCNNTIRPNIRQAADNLNSWLKHGPLALKV